MLPSENLPVAVNCCADPASTEGFDGVTVIAVNAAGVTVSTVEPLMAFCAAVIVVVPTEPAAASPKLLIVAAAEFDDDQRTWLLRSCVLLSEYLPVAVNCCVDPTASEGFAGLTVMEVSTGCITVRNVDPEIAFRAALIDVVPTATPVATPELAIVAAAGFVDVHVTWLVRSFVLPSEYLPVAVNCFVVPAAMDGDAGVTVI